MRTFLATSMLVLTIGAASAVRAGDYHAHISNCRATVEEWTKREADNGRKILETHGQLGAIRELTIRWDSGTIQRITVGPAILPDGQSAICVLARSHLGRSDVRPSGYTK